jgi:hypothetical protein
VFRVLKRYKKLGLGNEISHPHPTILETSWKFSEIPEKSWKFSGSSKNSLETLAKDLFLFKGPLSNRFMKIVYHTTNLYFFVSIGFYDTTIQLGNL